MQGFIVKGNKLQEIARENLKMLNEWADLGPINNSV